MKQVHKDKNGREIYIGCTIMLDCGCCFYDIIWHDDYQCFWPKDDGLSQVHNKDIDVWNCDFSIID